MVKGDQVIALVDLDRAKAPNWQLTYLVVDPLYQRQGYGSLLLAGVKQIMVQAGGEALLVEPSDEAIDYFKMNGFSWGEEGMEWKLDKLS